MSDKRVRHGLRNHPLYGRWNGMMQRCTDPNHVGYARYGGRGITVCERWKNFTNFLEDMGMPPPGHTLERLDSNKGYSPDNCVWATFAQQNRNRSTTRIYEYEGRAMCVSEWARELGIAERTLSERLQKWPLHRALTTPKQH